jgi:hypothetical protein
LDSHHIAINAVVNGKRESLGQTAMVAEDDLVNSGVEKQRVDV